MHHTVRGAACVALCVAGLALHAQQPAPTGPSAGAGALYGAVINDESAAPLAGAAVVLVTDGEGIVVGDRRAGVLVMQSRTTTTDVEGRYRFDGVTAGAYLLRFHRLGFRPATVGVVLRGADERISVGLAVVPVRLQPMAVSSEQPAPYPASVTASLDAEGAARVAAILLRQRIYLAADVREVTHADVVEGVTLGESDLFRALQRLPGVTSRNELSAELWTRSARWDRTRVLFDGLPLFNPLHAVGAYSAVDENAIGSAFLHSGVRPASIGEGGAGVLDIHSRSGGGTGRMRGIAEVTTMSERAALDQRVADGRGAWMVAARRSTGLTQLPRIRYSVGNEPIDYSELSTRADWAFDAGWALEVSALHERDFLVRDDFTGQGTMRARWGNDVVRVTLETPRGSLVARHTVGLSRYRGVVDSATRSLGLVDAADFPVGTGVSYLTVGTELSPSTPGGAALPWMAGWELVHQTADAAGATRAAFVGDWFDTTSSARRASLTTLAVWAERRAHPINALTIEPGLRLEVGNALRGSGLVRISPRLTARFAPGDSSVLWSASAGRSYQYAQALEPINAVHPSTPGLVPLWLMADGDTPAVRTDLITVGAERWFDERWHGAVTAYTRSTDGLLVPDPRPGSITAHELFVDATESSHGVEGALRRIQGRWTTQLGVQYGVANIHAAGLRYAASEDRRYAYDMTVLSRLGRSWRVGGAFSASSGAPFTRVIEGVEVFDKSTLRGHWDPAPITEGPNALRLPNYEGLDLLADWSGDWKWGTRIGVNLQLHDVYSSGTAPGYSGYSPCVDSPATGPCTRRDYNASEGGFQPFVGVRIAF